MIRALGFSRTEFDPSRPGRLCRGRERWIEPWEPTDETPAPEGKLIRVVLTGSEFSDDSAADARRGLTHAGVDLATTIATLFPRRALVAFMEDGHPADIPEAAEGVEMYTGHRAGGKSEELMVRWFMKVDGITQLREVIGQGDEPGVLGFAWLHPGIELDDDVRQRFFLLVGMGNLDSPPARFQPAALPDVLEVARAVILLHRDKHGPALGVYASADPELEPRIRALAEEHEVLAVPFAIPPMLARWDRALAELRSEWLETRDDEFPVPPSPEPTRWTPRRRGRRSRKDLDREARGEE